MLRNTVLSIHALLLIFNLYILGTDIIIPKEYVLGYCIFIGVSIFNFLRTANFIVLAYTAGFTSVLVAAYLLQALSEQVKFNGWMQAALFQTELMSRTNTVIMVGISSFCIAAILSNRNNKRLFETKNPTLNFFEKKSKNWVAFISVVVGVFFSAISSAPSLGETSYAGGGAAVEIGAESSSVGYIMGIVFTAVSAYLAYHNSSFKSIFVNFIFGLVLLVMLYFNLYSGDRDGMLTYAVLFLGMFWVYNKMSYSKKSILIMFAGVGLYILLMVVGQARGVVSEVGVIKAVASTEVLSSNEAFSPTNDLDLLPIMYWQTLASVDLYDRGISFNMKSFINLIPQSIPTPIANFFGYTRPMNVAWELGQYHMHGGGYFVIGETYWNGGIIAVIAVFSVLAWLLINLERWFFKQEKYLLAFYFGLIASSPTCIYYSFQGMARWIEVWVGFAIFFKIWIATVKIYEMKKRKRLECVAS